MPEPLMTVEMAKRLNRVVENCTEAFVLNHGLAIERQALEHEVLRLRSVNGELHGKIALLAARVEELEGEGQKREARSEKQEKGEAPCR